MGEGARGVVLPHLLLQVLSETKAAWLSGRNLSLISTPVVRHLGSYRNPAFYQ